MDFEINRTAFARALKLAAAIADRRSSTMPILANVVIRAHLAGPGEDGAPCVEIVATDLTTSITYTLPATVKAHGVMAVNAKTLHDVIASAPGETARIAEDRAAGSASTRLSVKAGKASFRVATVDVRDFPRIVSTAKARFAPVDPGKLCGMFDRTLFSVCDDETRFHLNGVLFGGGYMVSTDGHRLSIVNDDAMPPLAKSVIIPRKGAAEARKLLSGADGAKAAMLEGHIAFQTDDATLTIKLVDATFPPHDQVVPKKSATSATVDRAALVDAVDRSRLIATTARGPAFAFAPDSIRITTSSPDGDEIVETVDAEVTGPDLTIGFNPAYVAELLAAMTGDQITIELNGELDPGLFRDGDYVGVVMPMRV